LPKQPILTNESGDATLPPLAINIDGTKPGHIAISIPGYPGSVDVASAVYSVTLDGISLLGRSTPVKFVARSQHKLVLKCSP
jgi:hypothetical protein